MFERAIELPEDHSFFLFGQRGTGKSTLLERRIANFSGSVLHIDLLDSQIYQELSRQPWRLRERIEGFDTVFIDEIQKIPALLDEVHKAIESKSIRFLLTGSSARKLKRSGVNLLAGRAIQYRLYPLSFLELGDQFDLDQALSWGTLPEVVTTKSEKLRLGFLHTYVDTYLKEEIAYEQIVRDLNPFSRFLEVAAQCNGESINYANLASDSGVSAKTVKSFYSILEDTLLGFRLPSYHKSIRKQQRKAEKFYFYDLGVVRALNNNLGVPLLPKTSEYGKLFEAYIINEFVRLNEYMQKRFRFYQLRVGHKDEIDLIIEAPDKSVTLIELKARATVSPKDVSSMHRLSKQFDDPQTYVLSQDKTQRVIGGTRCVHWQQGLAEIFDFPQT